MKKRERTNEYNRMKIKKWKGEKLSYDTLFLSLPDGTWQKNERHTTTRPWIDFKCRACGFIHTIGHNHTIDDKGMVNPSFGLSGGNCALHEWLHLEDWEPEKVKRDD